ncbi:DNA helicase [Providencia phage PSTCR5]|uniref:DNA helicase n=1 Tax=Providencia phage PSTCR5 TaxID=2783547 RepID=A0A873WTC0_9CAUD|nr:DNA helicase [Providencia phage PSTCR5]QPB12114.1 DNA helicase [Providencia phage PSTCR5]
MKISIGNKAFFMLRDPDFWDEIRPKMTYEIMDRNTQYPKIYQNCGKIRTEMVWIPITRVADVLKGIDLEVTDRRVAPEADFPDPSFVLRGDQTEIFDKFISSAEDWCIINGKPGFGKTITALAIAHYLGVKTLVVTTNVNIRTQWEDEVRKWFGIEPGVIGSSRFELDSPIVIGNIQTLSKHGERLAKEFGLVIVDEMHHCVATTFTKFLEFSYAKYRIGLSGTLKRKDGLNVMFPDYFGYTVFSPAVANTLDPTIYKFHLPEVELSGNRNIPWALRANEVYENPLYRAHIISKTYIMYREGHKVLVVSDRSELISHIAEKLESVGTKVHQITGQTSIEDRKSILLEIETDPTPCVLVAAVGIFSEGVSCNPLSCLVHACIIGDNESLIEQLGGRIQRIAEGKLPPVILDTRLGGDVAQRQAATRTRVYNQNGWTSREMTEKVWDKYLKKVLDQNPIS